MAIIQCKECGQDVSDQAKICPHCGYPMQEILDKADINEEKRAYIREYNLKQLVYIILTFGLGYYLGTLLFKNNHWINGKDLGMTFFFIALIVVFIGGLYLIYLLLAKILVKPFQRIPSWSSMVSLCLGYVISCMKIMNAIKYLKGLNLFDFWTN